MEMYRLHYQMVQRLHDGHLELLRTVNTMNQRLIRYIENTQHAEPQNGAVGEQTTQTNETARNENEPELENTQTFLFNTPLRQTGETQTRTSSIRNQRLRTPPQLNRSIRRQSRQPRQPYHWYNPFSIYSFPVNRIRPLQNVNTTRFEDVPIPVDERTIQLVTETFAFDGSNNEMSTCPIDLSEFSVGDEVMRIRECGHIFRKSNLLRWFETNPRCPICRRDVRDAASMSNTENRDNRENQENNININNVSAASAPTTSTHTTSTSTTSAPIEQTETETLNNSIQQMEQDVQQSVQNIFNEFFPGYSLQLYTFDMSNNL